MQRVFKFLALATLLFTQANAAWVRKGTTVVYINGIGTVEVSSDPKGTSAETQRFTVEQTLRGYLRSISYTGQYPTVEKGYNRTDGRISDLVQSAQNAVGITNLLPLLVDIYKLSDPSASPFAMIGAGTVISSYTEELARTRTVKPTVRPDDYVTILNRVKDLLRQGQQVILLGHSQGNFYTNFVYEEISANTAFLQEIGLTLPNSNALNMVGISVPSSYMADGRNMYLTHCNDAIQLVPGHLPANFSSSGCAVANVITGPLSISQATQYATELRNLASFPSTWSGFFGRFKSLFNLPRAVLYVWRLYDAVQQHYLEKGYLTSTDGSLTNISRKIVRMLEDSLPDPGCGGDANCYLKDSFRTIDYTGNWLQTGDLQAAKNSSAKQASGILELYTKGYFVAGGGSGSTVYAPGKITLRTRRVFTGPFKADLQFNHIGGGVSTISLKKAVDNTTALSITVNNGPGQNSVKVYPASSVPMPTASNFRGWRQLTFTKTDTRVGIAIGSTSWALNTSDTMSGYYLELNSVGDNTLQIRNLSVVRTGVTPPPPPPPTLTATCSANPVVILAGQSTVFTGSSTGGTGAKTGIWGGVASGSGLTANYSTAASTPAGFYKATYTVTDSGSPKQTVTANCSVQVNSPVVVTTSLNETFTTPYANNWTYAAMQGNPTVTQTSGDLKVLAPRTGSNATFLSKLSFTGDVDVTFTLNHQGFGRNSLGLALASNSSSLPASVTLDTNDTAYLSFASGSQATEYKYSSSPYMNRTVVFRLKVVGSQVQFYADSILMETMPFSASGPVRIFLGIGSVSWKSGDNITDFYNVTATIGSTVPSAGTVNISATKDGSAYTGSLSCALATPSGQQAIGSVPASLSNQPAGSYTLACTAPAGTTISSIIPSFLQTLPAGGTVNFGVTLKTIQTTAPLSNVTCSVSSTSVNVNQPVIYTANWSGGSGSPGFNWTGYISGTTRSVNWAFTSPGTYTASVLVMDNGQQVSANCPAVTVTQPTVTILANPLPTPPAGVYWTWNLSAWQYLGSSWVIQPVLNFYGTDYRFDHPQGYIQALKQLQGWGASGPLDRCISEFQAALPYWPPYVVVVAPPTTQPLSVTWFTYSPESPKTTDTITLQFYGSGLSSSTEVWVFGLNCVNGCQAAVVASSISATSMQALAQLRSVDNFQVKVRNTPSGTFVLAGTVPVR